MSDVNCNQSVGAGFAAAHGWAAGVPEWFSVSEDNPNAGGHLWGKHRDWPWPLCLHCMMIRRADRQNKPCEGPGKLRDLKRPNIKLTDRRHE
jgi:hypothetical protein